MKLQNKINLKKTENSVIKTFKIKNVQLFVIVFFLISSLFTIFTPFASASHATIDINPDFYSYEGAVRIFVTDLAKIDAGSVQVTVTTTRPDVGVIDSITLTLLESSTPGVFNNIDPTTGIGTLWLMDGDNKFPLDAPKAIRYSDPFVYDPDEQETLTIPISTNGIFKTFVDLTETGKPTEIGRAHV